MPKLGGRVHIAETRRHYKGKEYTTTLLRRSYREGGKVKNETVGNLSHLEAWMIDGLRAMLAGRRLADLDEEFEIVRSLPHGPVAAVLFDVVPRGIAATVMGAYVFFIHIAGDAIALPVVGALSDRFGLRPALLSLPMVGLLGGVVLLFALFTVRGDMDRVRPQPA